MIERMEIHSHTEYSNLRLKDAINQIEKLADRAIEIGLKGLAITEHDCLSGTVRLNKYAKKLQETHPDFKLAIGNEIYLCGTRDKKQKYFHFILIAKNREGYQALKELSSRAWLNSYEDRRMERVVTLYSDLAEIVKKYPNSLIATSACLGGELGVSILQMLEYRNTNQPEAAKREYDHILSYLNFCQTLFKDDFYLEIAPACSKEQIMVNKMILNISKAVNIPIVIGSDAHYLKKEDRYIHKAFLTSKDGEREVDSFYEYCYLQDNEEEIVHLTKSYGEQTEEIFKAAAAASMIIYDKIEFYDLFHTQQIPTVEIKEYPKKEINLGEDYPQLNSMFKSDDKMDRYWINQCWDKLNEIFDNPLKTKIEYVKELEEEAKVKAHIGKVLDTNIFGYPVLLQHYIDMMWECGSTIGTGRGSAGAALNHWLLGITQLDPIQWNLPFFRYLNLDRVELPDVDIDISPSRRPLILQKIKQERAEKYFDKNLDELSKKNLGCTLVATFKTESAKSAILTACFKKGTLVDTFEGEKFIEDIQVGDLVKTLNGYEKVLYPTQTTGKIQCFVKTKNSVNEGFYCTADHELLTVSAYRKVKGEIATKEMKEIIPELKQYPSTDNVYNLFAANFRKVTPEWKQAKDLIKNVDYGLTLIDTQVEDITSIHWTNNFKQKFGIGISEEIEISNDFCELIGIWIAEGSINKSHNTVSFTIHQKEENLKNRIIKLMWTVFQLDNVTITTRKTSQALTIAYSSSQLAQFFFELFGNIGEWRERRADNTYHYLTQWDKRIPEVLKYIEPQKQLQIIKGWFLGDGYAIDDGHRRGAKITTVSKQLAKDMIEIFHRNFINPGVDVEKRSLNRTDRCDCFNLTLYGEYASVLYKMKYVDTNYEQELKFDLSIRRKIDVPVLYQNKLYMLTKLEVKMIENDIKETVYCLKMPNGNFSVNNTIVHNCRGYRSSEYPNGIDSDIGQFLSSLIPVERGFTWSLKEVLYGDEEKDRKPVQLFIQKVNEFKGLIDIALGIEGMISGRSSHASGVIMFDKNPYEHCCFMRTPKGEVITQYDLHDAEFCGATKLDFLVTSIQDKIAETLRFLQQDGQIEKKLTLREAYEKYLHPDVLPIDDKRTWKAIQEAETLDLFQFDSDIGRQGAKRVKPETMMELSSANGLIRLMTTDKSQETPMDKYVRFKKHPEQWVEEMNRYGLTKEEQNIMRIHIGSTNGIGISQEQLMRSLMDKKICGFSLKEANQARKIIAKFLAVRIEIS